MKKKLSAFIDQYPQKSKPLSLRQNFSWTFVGNAVYGICQWGILVVLAKLGTPEMVGQFTFGLAVITPIILFFNLHLRTVQATDAKQQYLFSDYLELRLISTALAQMVIMGLSFITGYGGEAAIVIFLLGIAKSFESISDVFYGLLQQHEQMDKISKSTILKSLLSLFTLTLGLYFTHNLVWATLCLVVSGAVTLIGYDIPNSSSLGKLSSQQKPEKTQDHYYKLRKLAGLAWFALPVGLLTMMLALSGNIPRYFIERYLGQRELGIFAALAYIPTAGIVVVSALGQSALPRLAKYYATGNKAEFKKLIFQLVCLGALLGLCGLLAVVIAGKQILTLLYQPEYAKQTKTLVWLMFAGGILYISSFLGCATTAARYFMSTLLISILVVGITTLFSFWLIPSRGLEGASIVLVINGITQVFFYFCVIIHVLNRLPKLNHI